MYETSSVSYFIYTCILKLSQCDLQASYLTWPAAKYLLELELSLCQLLTDTSTVLTRSPVCDNSFSDIWGTSFGVAPVYNRMLSGIHVNTLTIYVPHLCKRRIELLICHTGWILEYIPHAVSVFETVCSCQSVLSRKILEYKLDWHNDRVFCILLS